MTVRCRPIPGFPGYKISSNGDLFSCRTNGGKIGKVWKRLKPKVDKDGYLEKGLSRNGKAVFKKVHQWVMLAFVGPPPKGMQVRHKDGIRSNINVDNLEYGTVLQNQRDRFKHGTDPTGERHPKAKLKEKDILKIRKDAKTTTHAELANRFHTSVGYIDRIVARSVWKHI